MGSLEGVYEGRIISLGDGNATAFVPQVFGDTQVTISDFLAQPMVGMGWVSFQAGDPEFPVWLSGRPSSGDDSGGGGSDGFSFTQDTAPTATALGQTWYNTSNGASLVWIIDGDSEQWVQFAPGSGGGGGEGGGSDGYTFTQDTAPSPTTHGQTWFDTSTGDSFVWVIDADTSQWVQTAPGGGGGGGSGFTFVQDTAPTPTKEGDTWFDLSDAASGGTSWVAVSEVPGAAGPLNWVQFAPGTGKPTTTIELFTGSSAGNGATGITAATGPFVTSTLFTIPDLVATDVVDFQLKLYGYNTGGQGQQATIRINGTSIGQNLIVPTTSNTTPFIAAAPFRTTGRTGAAAVTVSVGEWYGNTVYSQGIDLYATVYRK